MNITITKDVSLLPYNTLGVAASCDSLAELSDAQQLTELLSVIRANQWPHLTIGSGSNILFTQHVNGLVIHNAIKGITLLKEGPAYVWLQIGAGEIWHDVVTYCVARGYGGIENLSSIPGTAGAAPIQNIGAYGAEFENIFASLKAMHVSTGQTRTFDCPACEFAYRNSFFKQHPNQFIITEITLRLDKQPRFNLSYQGLLEHIDEQPINLATISQAVTQLRQHKLPDPSRLHNAGSFFKNPMITEPHLHTLQQQHPNIPYYPVDDTHTKIPAAWLIEQLGFKGQRCGQAGVYEQHALVLVNHQHGGSGDELMQLATQIQQQVKAAFAIELIPEVNIL